MENNELTKDMLDGDKVLFVHLNQTYKNGLTTLELENITRGNWDASVKRAEKLDYVLGHKDHKIVTAYKPKKGSWVKMKKNEDPEKFENKPRDFQDDRAYFEIETNLTPEEEARLDFYLGKDISKLFDTNQNPMHYFD